MLDLKPFLEDRSRWFLWWPVGLGIGISLYFSLPFEPLFYQVLLLFFATLSAAGYVLIYWRDRFCTFILTMIIFSICAGFTAAKIRTDLLGTPFLSTKIETVKMNARITDIEEQPNRRRLTLDQITFLEDGPILHKVRLTMPLSKPLTATIGDRVSLHASLLPLSAPVTLNGYHFRRQAYFQGIGAIGRVLSPLHIMEKPDQHLWLATTRFRLTQTIRQHLAGQTGEIAAALITGDRSGIHPNIRQAFTDAGLAHILAISGLHLTLVAGLIFLLFRRGLALIPPLAEKYPIKKWAAMLVGLATFGYLAISGFGIPGQRAFVMISIVMLGILFDRNPLSMRLVAIAATVILIFRPESLLSASFQLSFAAVVGLIAAYEDGWGLLRQWSFQGGAIRRLIAYSAGLIATTIIATLATTPYTLALFNRITLQSIVGNFLAIPLTSVLIMPAATFSVLSLPFGGFSFAFQILSFGLNQLIYIAQTVASWPGAAIMVPTPSPIFIILMTLGGLWLCIWKNHWRWGGLILCALGCMSLLISKPANIYVAGDGSVIAYRWRDTLFVSNLNRGSFFSDQWMKELGLTHKQDWPQDQMKIGPVLLVRPDPFAPYTPLRISKQMCQEKGLVTTSYAWRECKRHRQMPKVLIDRFTLQRDGTYQIWITPREIEVKSVRKYLGVRPWNSR